MEQSKKYRKGFTLGKFMPPHLGHLHMIRAAMQQVEEMTVLVCSIKKEPIPGELRYQWMKALLPGVRIIHITDEVPSYPHESPDFWNIWVDLLKREIDPLTEVFFSGEDYGDEVANRLGLKHEMIDRRKQDIPMSATAVRNNPLKNHHFLPDLVKPYFIKRIVLTGPESTGKTTMAKILAEKYNTTWVAEYGRDYFIEKEGKLVQEDILAIAKGQLKLEDQAATKASKLLFCDTDLIVTQIWSEIYFGQCSNRVIELSHTRHYDLYFLLDIDIPWEDDGTREFPHLREWHFNRLKEELETRKLNYVVVSGSLQERLHVMEQQIKTLFE